MSEQPRTKRSSIASTLIWAVAGVLIGLTLFAITLFFNRPNRPNDAGPTPSTQLAQSTQSTPSTSATQSTQSTQSTAPPITEIPNPVSSITYTVQPGDVLGAIAERFGVRASAILQANARTLTNPDSLQVGQVLSIPGGAAQPAPTAGPTPPPAATVVMQKHVIAKGEVLSTIALKYGVSVKSLRDANNLTNDTIRVGDTLNIPIDAIDANNANDANAATTTPTKYAFSILEGDLAQGYPLSKDGSNFSVHYQPDTLAAQEINDIVIFLEQSQKAVAKSLGVRFTGRFDVYLAGSLFAPPNQALRGRSFSSQRSVFVLYDGSGDDNERRYMLTHELTHLIAWNTYGPAKSAMLSEGAAVFAGEPYLLKGSFIAIRDFCLAYRRANTLPLVASPSLSFQGHLLSLDGYYASGCFVQYLLKTYGTAKFGKLYSRLDYTGIYGKSLDQLQKNWLTNLDADKTKLPFDAAALPASYEALLKDYGAFFAKVSDGDVNAETYRDLDQRRLNLLQGK